MQIWLLILIAAITSYILRMLPFLFSSETVLHKETWFFKLMDYAVYAVIGGIIYTTAFHGKTDIHLAQMINRITVLKISVIFLAFFLSCFSKRLLQNFILCVTGYALFSYFLYT